MCLISIGSRHPFCLYHKKSKNIIDNLLFQFQENGWLFNNCNNTSSWKTFDWPDIVLTKREFDHNDFWGLYEFEEVKEGQVLLQYNRIFESSKEYSDSYKVNDVRISKSFFLLVGIHEFIHWIMHFIPNKYGNESNIYFDKIRYNTEDEKDFHECFAQLFTYLIAQKDKNLSKLFKWKVSLQKGSYLKYQELVYDGITLKDAITLLSSCRYLKIQSFTETKILYEEIIKRRKFDKIEPEEWIIGNLLNWQSINL